MKLIQKNEMQEYMYYLRLSHLDFEAEVWVELMQDSNDMRLRQTHSSTVSQINDIETVFIWPEGVLSWILLLMRLKDFKDIITQNFSKNHCNYYLVANSFRC